MDRQGGSSEEPGSFFTSRGVQGAVEPSNSSSHGVVLRSCSFDTPTETLLQTHNHWSSCFLFLAVGGLFLGKSDPPPPFSRCETRAVLCAIHGKRAEKREAKRLHSSASFRQAKDSGRASGFCHNGLDTLVMPH